LRLISFVWRRRIPASLNLIVRRREMRIVGAVMVFIGIYIGIRLGLDWRTFFQPAPSLCGCEFDAAVKHRTILTFLAACCIAVLAAIAGVALIRRYRRGLLVLAAWFLGVAVAAWIDQIVPLPYPVEPSAPVNSRVIFSTGVCVTLAFVCLLSYRISSGAWRCVTRGDA